MKRATVLSAIAGALLFVMMGASVAAAAPADSTGADSTTIATNAPAQTFAADSPLAPREVAPPRVPDARVTRVAPPATNRFVVLSLALLGIAAIGAATAFTGFSIVSRF